MVSIRGIYRSQKLKSRFNHKAIKIIIRRAEFFFGVTRSEWGLFQRGKKRGRNERLEKRIEGIERWFLRKNEVLLKVKKKGKNCF